MNQVHVVQAHPSPLSLRKARKALVLCTAGYSVEQRATELDRTL